MSLDIKIYVQSLLREISKHTSDHKALDTLKRLISDTDFKVSECKLVSGRVHAAHEYGETPVWLAEIDNDPYFICRWPHHELLVARDENRRALLYVLPHPEGKDATRAAFIRFEDE